MLSPGVNRSDQPRQWLSRWRRSPRPRPALPQRFVVCYQSDDRPRWMSYSRTASDDGVVHDEKATAAAKIENVPVVALLCRSLYLIKIVDVPRVDGQELEGMLRLETEAWLPREFGEAEISFRELEGAQPGYQRFEVYCCRRDELKKYLESISRAVGAPSLVLPGAVLWAQLLQAEKTFSVLWWAWDAEHLEVATLELGGAISVRALNSGGPERAAISSRGLMECVRAALTEDDSSESIRLMWTGAASPPQSLPRRMTVHCLHSQNGVPSKGQSRESSGDSGLLESAARVLAAMPESGALTTANMMPRDLREARARHVLHRRLMIGSGAIALALILVFGALKIATWRLMAKQESLENKILAVRSRGEFIGRQLEQLAAVRRIRGNHDLFQRVLDALYDATPQGITYSNVDVHDDGTLVLRGQAPSLSLPFLLPERLAKQGMFAEVSLKNAVQNKKGEGSLTEFRVECRLKRRNP